MRRIFRAMSLGQDPGARKSGTAPLGMIIRFSPSSDRAGNARVARNDQAASAFRSRNSGESSKRASSRRPQWPGWHSRTKSTLTRFSVGRSRTNTGGWPEACARRSRLNSAGDDLQFCQGSGSGACSVLLQLPKGRVRIEAAVDPPSLRLVLECLMA
jgi:hypothetical protein